jgi:protein gp37
MERTVYQRLVECADGEGVMGENSKIEWTHHTFNPWWGCVKVSEGCAHCYAETLSTHYGHNVWGPAKTTPRRLFGEKHWQEPLKWDRQAQREGTRKRVFCASMADVFEDHPQVVDARTRLFNLISDTPHLAWLLLTKRPENIKPMLIEAGRGFQSLPPWVWIGTSVENQEQADKRIPHLLNVPAHVRFLSCEPLLGPVDLSHLANRGGEQHGLIDGGIHWVIVGGESGAGARPMHPDWARSLRDQCETAGVAFHFKQWGGTNKKATGRILDGRTWDQFPEVNHD